MVFRLLAGRSFFSKGWKVLFYIMKWWWWLIGCCHWCFRVCLVVVLLFNCKSRAQIVCYSAQCYKHQYFKLFSSLPKILFILLMREKREKDKQSKQNIQLPKSSARQNKMYDKTMCSSQANATIQTAQQICKIKELFRPVLCFDFNQ